MSSSPTKIILKTFSLQTQGSTFSPMPEKTIHKSYSSNAAERKAVNTPLEIGTRGTVESLITQEIKYFKQLEMKCQNKTPECKPSIRSIITSPTKKKKGNSRLIPSMCSVVDVVEKRDQSYLCSRFSYRSLKADVETLQV